jgi:hypothetical protein
MDASSSFLERGRVKAGSVSGSGAVLRCSEGVVWLTCTDDPEDHVIGAGEAFVLKPGRWVAQALRSSRFEVSRCATLSKEVSDGKATIFPVLQRL